MKYAVVSAGGKQYRVAAGDVIEIDRIEAKPEDKHTFSQVLLHVDDGKREIGKPYLTDVSVTGTVLGQKKLRKVRVAKFKAKARYRKVSGFRASVTMVKIEDITQKKAAAASVIKEK